MAQEAAAKTAVLEREVDTMHRQEELREVAHGQDLKEKDDQISQMMAELKEKDAGRVAARNDLEEEKKTTKRWKAVVEDLQRDQERRELEWKAGQQGKAEEARVVIERLEEALRAESRRNNDLTLSLKIKSEELQGLQAKAKDQLDSWEKMAQGWRAEKAAFESQLHAKTQQLDEERKLRSVAEEVAVGVEGGIDKSTLEEFKLKHESMKMINKDVETQLRRVLKEAEDLEGKLSKEKQRTEELDRTIRDWSLAESPITSPNEKASVRYWQGKVQRETERVEELQRRVEESERRYADMKKREQEKVEGVKQVAEKEGEARRNDREEWSERLRVEGEKRRGLEKVVGELRAKLADAEKDLAGKDEILGASASPFRGLEEMRKDMRRRGEREGRKLEDLQKKLREKEVELEEREEILRLTVEEVKRLGELRKEMRAKMEERALKQRKKIKEEREGLEREVEQREAAEKSLRELGLRYAEKDRKVRELEDKIKQEGLGKEVLQKKLNEAELKQQESQKKIKENSDSERGEWKELMKNFEEAKNKLAEREKKLKDVESRTRLEIAKREESEKRWRDCESKLVEREAKVVELEERLRVETLSRAESERRLNELDQKVVAKVNRMKVAAERLRQESEKKADLEKNYKELEMRFAEKQKKLKEHMDQLGNGAVQKAKYEEELNLIRRKYARKKSKAVQFRIKLADVTNGKLEIEGKLSQVLREAKGLQGNVQELAAKNKQLGDQLEAAQRRVKDTEEALREQTEMLQHNHGLLELSSQEVKRLVQEEVVREAQVEKLKGKKERERARLMQSL